MPMSDLDSPIQPSITDEHWVYTAPLTIHLSGNDDADQSSSEGTLLSSQQQNVSRIAYLIYLLINLVMLLLGAYLLLRGYYFGACFIGVGMTNVGFLAMPRRWSR
jgi:hypothetical protein